MSVHDIFKTSNIDEWHNSRYKIVLKQINSILFQLMVLINLEASTH